MKNQIITELRNLRDKTTEYVKLQIGPIGINADVGVESAAIDEVLGDIVVLT